MKSEDELKEHIEKLEDAVITLAMCNRDYVDYFIENNITPLQLWENSKDFWEDQVAWVEIHKESSEFVKQIVDKVLRIYKDEQS